MDEVLLKVEGMTCNHCVMTVTKALEGVTGVKKAKVDLETGTAKVKFDSSKTNIDSLINSVVEAGYKATAI